MTARFVDRAAWESSGILFFFFLKIERLEGFPFILLLLIFNQLCCFGSVAFEKPVRYLSGNFN